MCFSFISWRLVSLIGFLPKSTSFTYFFTVFIHGSPHIIFSCIILFINSFFSPSKPCLKYFVYPSIILLCILEANISPLNVDT